MITVTDNGCAMDEVTLNQVFDPYFTTKEDGADGLGLSQVYGFVKSGNGALTVESQLGDGYLAGESR